MIQSFKNKGIENFFSTGSMKSIQPKHRKKLRLILAKLHTARNIDDMAFPGSYLHQMKGKRKGIWSVKVDENWRITFRFQDNDVYDVDYEDYH